MYAPQQTLSTITGTGTNGQAIAVNSGAFLGLQVPAFGTATKWRLQGSVDGGATFKDVYDTDGTVKEYASSSGGYLATASYLAEFAGYTHVRPVVSTAQAGDVLFIATIGAL